MKKKILWITRTALMLALLVAAQYITKPFGQLVTGSCVNAVLTVTAMVVGLSGSVVVALVSPVLAYLLGIAPQLVTVPAIMVGNAVFVWLIHQITDGQCKPLGNQISAWLIASFAKFAVLYLLVVKIICGIAAEPLMAAGTLKAPMLKMLPAMFAWPQLITALIGSGVGLLIAPILKKTTR